MKPAQVLSTIMAASLCGCAASAPPVVASSSGMTPVAFHCPKPGATATVGTSRLPISFDGADPADPLVCLGKFQNGTAFRRIANLLTPPPGQDRAIRDGIAPLFPIVPGKTAEFSYFQGYTNDRFKTGQFVERWATLGPETLTIAGQPVQTIVFTREVENSQTYGSLGINSRLWFAPDAGVWVRGDTTVVRGQSNARSFVVTKLTTP